MQTRLQKRLQEALSVKEKMAVETLIEISNTPIPDIDDSPLNEYSFEVINDAKDRLARKYSKATIEKYDKPIPELVKYCKYNGSYEQQINQSIKNKDMETYHALINYRNNMLKYDEVHKYIKDNFMNIRNNISDDEVLNYLQGNYPLENLRAKKDLEDKKIEVEQLKHLKYLKDHITAKERILNEMQTNISFLKEEFDEKMNQFKIKYNC